VATALHFLEVHERFLPVDRAALLERMVGDPRLSAIEREQLIRLFEMVATRFHFEFHKKLECLKSLYDPFDPDCDMVALPADPAQQESKRQELARAFQQLLLDANYSEMPHRQIVACAEFPSQSKLVVKTDLSRYAQLRVFYRGIRHETQTERPWLAPWRQESRMVHIFSRVALFVRLAHDSDASKDAANPIAAKDPIFLKLFKNIVVEDLEMLLPYVRIRMRLFDHLKIGTSVAGGVATASWKVFTASFFSPWLLLLVLTGFVGAAFRGFFGFLSSKTKYMQTLSSNLYFQNLANNTSALAHLVDCAEAEECKELLLAYFILYVERSRNFTQAELGRRVEEWLKREFGLDVTLEVTDVVRKLSEKNLLVHCTLPALSGDCPNFRANEKGTVPLGDADEILRVYDLPSALRRLDTVWDGYYAYSDVQAPEQDRLADADWPAASHDGSERVKETTSLRRIDAEESPGHKDAGIPYAVRGVN
jgi:hypothetical protein